MNTIDVENLSVNLGGKPILKQLSLAVSEGTVCALLGPNGAGKTTLLKTLVGIYPYRNGEASILGKEVSTLKPSDFTQIGYVSESQELPDWLSISSYLSLCRKMYSNWDRDWENHLLDLLDLQKHLRQPMNKLSRGMRMKASLISSLSYKPSLLVLDEPFGGLDPVVRDDFIAAVIDLANEVNATTVVSSHDLEEVEQVADSIAFLIDGSIPLHAPLDFLLSKYRKVTVVSSDDLGQGVKTRFNLSLVRFLKQPFEKSLCKFCLMQKSLILKR